MINYKKLNKQIHPLTSKKLPEYIQRGIENEHLTNKRGYIFIPTHQEYINGIYPVSASTSKKKFRRWVLEFFPELFTPTPNTKE